MLNLVFVLLNSHFLISIQKRKHSSEVENKKEILITVPMKIREIHHIKIGRILKVFKTTIPIPQRPMIS